MKKKLFLLDMDGTIYLGETLFKGTAEFLAWVRNNGGQYVFLSNNSSRGIEGYLAKMQRMGIPQDESRFLTSVHATIEYLKNTYPPFCNSESTSQGKDPSDSKAPSHGECISRETEYYVCGTENLKGQLRDAGLKVLTDAEVEDRIRDGNIPVLLLGFDTELTYQKLENSVKLLNLGADYIATHPDLTCPVEYGYAPDIGLVINDLKVCTGREPLVIGKPQPTMVYTALRKYGATADETVLIGDRLYTDIACGNNAGIDTILVLSGEGTAEDCEKYGVHPTYIYKDIEAVLDALKRGEL